MGAVATMTLEAGVLKRLRAAAGLTQQELAFRSGLSIAQVVALEQGKRVNPRLTTLRALAGALGCKVGDLADTGDPPPAKSKGRGK